MDHTYTITLYAIAHKYMRFHMKFSNKTCPLWPNHQHNQEKVVLFLHQAVSVTLFRYLKISNSLQPFYSEREKVNWITWKTRSWFWIRKGYLWKFKNTPQNAILTRNNIFITSSKRGNVPGDPFLILESPFPNGYIVDDQTERKSLFSSNRT